MKTGKKTKIMKLNNISKLVIAIAVSELAGAIGSVFTMPAIAGWYANIAKPAFAPPNWIFAPVWITLFALMGIAAFLVWRKGLRRLEVKEALEIFIGQLSLNSLWSVIFFGMRNPGAAFAEIIILWLAILAAIIYFFRVSKPAAWLLIPYILWVSFAGFLNYSIWRLEADNLKIAPNEASCEIKNCSNGIPLPEGYTLESYSIEKTTETDCAINSDCQTPGEYMVQSRCPFVSLCLQNKCAVVCPARKDLPWTSAKEIINNCEVEKLSQYHNRQTTLFLKDGRRLQTIQPRLDAVMELADSLESKCGKIKIATE